MIQITPRKAIVLIFSISLFAGFLALQSYDRATPVGSPAAGPATRPDQIMSGSKFTDLSKTLSYSYANPFADSTALDSGYRLTNNIKADFAVAADSKAGIFVPRPTPEPTTLPNDPRP